MKYINKILTSLILALLPCSDIAAKPVTAKEAELAVTGWLKKEIQPLGIPLGRQIAKVEPFVTNSGYADYYIVNLKPSGFIIVSANDLIEPIIGFADDGSFDPAVDNPLGALVNNDLSHRSSEIQDEFSLMTVTEGNIQTQSQNKWQTYLDIAKADAGGFSLMGLTCLCDVRVPPLVQSQWDQNYVFGKTCYNYYTPNNYPCGCLATAMAQLMRYFEFPTSGIGIREFKITVNNYPQLKKTIGGDGFGGPYKWSEMVLKPGSYSQGLSPAQRQAIGSICYDAGLAARMEYNQTASGAAMLYAKIALNQTFGYSNAILGENFETNINTQDLYKMINPSLDAGSPVVLGIFADSESNNGHAVLCDGYAYDSSISYTRDGNSYEVSTIYHHLNMGWSGVDDAWYNLPDINGQNKFKIITSCLYNIFTSGEGEIISGRVIDPNNNPISNAVVYAKSGRPISTLTDYRGIYAFKGLYSNTSYVIWANIDGHITAQQTVKTKTSQNENTACGNIWGVNFQADIEPNYVPSSIYYVDNDAPDDPAHDNTNISDSNEDGSPEHPFDSISEAIDAAYHGDMIIILPGIYTGNGNRDIDFKGKAITVRSENPNEPNLVIINCGADTNEPHRAFVFQNYEIPKSVLSGITITGGYHEYGGAIYLTDCAMPAITNCVFVSNKAGTGGAIYSNNSSPVISNCEFSENQADAGGAIYNYSGDSGSKPSVTSCNFSGNTSIYNGGAIYNSGQVSPSFTKCSFVSNYSAGGGGAIRNNANINLSLNNCIFSTNMAETFGGGIRSSNGSSVVLTNCTFYANFAGNGKSIACTVDDLNTYLAGNLKISNCIIVDGGNEIFNNDNSEINVTYSNLKDAESSVPWPGDGNIYADPIFADIEAGDFHLKSQAGRYNPNSQNWIIDKLTSPCIDTGDPQSQVSQEPEPNGGIINMGAYGGTNQASKSYSY
ncbi:MAG: C10 family peptidase [Sedimentisphaerales bacterium]|nr:C10 family peptidase [Sedimentisphaerales bacterium]